MGGSTKRWALMKLKSWNSLSSSLVLYKKIASNRCVHVTVTIIISLRSCYNWQQLCGVVRRLARQGEGGGGQDGGYSRSSGNLGVWRVWGGACFNLGHLPVCMGLGDRAIPHFPHLKTRVLLCVLTWINCPNYVCSTQTRWMTDTNKNRTNETRSGGVCAFRGRPGLGGACRHDRSTLNCFKWLKTNML